MPYDACLSVLVLIGLSVGTVLTGRAVANLLQIRLLRRWTPENVLASAFLGTAVLVLSAGYCSYLGLPALPGALIVLGLCASLVALRFAVRPRPALPGARRWLGLAVVLAPIVLATTVALLPVLTGDCLVFRCDSLLYDSVAEWLQGHGFWHPCPYDPEHPSWRWVALWQQCGHRMGFTFLLAMLRSLCPGSLAVHLYQPTTAWGVALNVAAVYLLCRWGFRCGKACAFTAALLVGGDNPLSFSAALGFPCQIYGSAVLLFTLAVLARLQTRSRWNLGGAVLFGLPAALQLSVYSEMAPILFIASLVYLAATALRAARSGRLARFLGFAAVTVLMFLLAGNVEILRATHAILFMMGLPAGWHQDWSALQYWSFTVGVRPLLFQGPVLIPTLVCSALFLIGTVYGVRRRRTWPTMAALLVLAGLAVYFRWFDRDPFTGTIGHTFSLFKLTNWAFTLVVVAQGVGLHALLRRTPRLRLAIVSIACVLVVLISAPRHRDNNRCLVLMFRDFAQSRTPLSSVRTLMRDVDELGASSLYFIPRAGGDKYYTAFIPYVFGNRTFVNGWGDPNELYYHPDYTADRNQWPPPDDLLGVMVGEPPYEEPLRRLPWGLSAVDLHHAFVVRIDGADGAAGASIVRVGAEATTIELWSPRTCAGTLALAALQSSLESGKPRLAVAPEGGLEREATFESNETSIPVALRPGLNRVRLRRLDALLNDDAPSSTLLIDKIRIHLDGEAP